MCKPLAYMSQPSVFFRELKKKAKIIPALYSFLMGIKPDSKLFLDHPNLQLPWPPIRLFETIQRHHSSLIMAGD